MATTNTTIRVHALEPMSGGPTGVLVPELQEANAPFELTARGERARVHLSSIFCPDETALSGDSPGTVLKRAKLNEIRAHLLSDFECPSMDDIISWVDQALDADAESFQYSYGHLH